MKRSSATSSNRWHRVVLALAILALAAPASAQLAKWDQVRVTALAKELRQATEALYDAYYSLPDATIGSGDSASRFRLKHKLRRIRVEARHLSDSLQHGDGHDETLPVYQHLMEIVRDARVDARRIFMPEPVLDKADAARDVLTRIAPYYDPKALEGSGEVQKD